MDGTRRADIKRGLRVSIVLKKDQQTGKLTEGIVRDILTNSPAHPHGIKVRLESGEIGRVKKILTCSQQFNATPVGKLRKVFPSLMFFWDDHLTCPGLFLLFRV